MISSLIMLYQRISWVTTGMNWTELNVTIVTLMPYYKEFKLQQQEKKNCVSQEHLWCVKRFFSRFWLHFEQRCVSSSVMTPRWSSRGDEKSRNHPTRSRSALSPAFITSEAFYRKAPQIKITHPASQWTPRAWNPHALLNPCRDVPGYHNLQDSTEPSVI